MVALWAILAIFFSSLSLSQSSYQERHKPSYVAEYVKDKVVRLYADRGYGHIAFIGTGFRLKMKSGKIYTVTAGHVCDASDRELYLKDKDRYEPLKFVTQHKDHDICVLDSEQELGYFTFAKKNFDKGDVYAAGHPADYPLAVTEGYILPEEQETTLIASDHKLKDCMTKGFHLEFTKKLLAPGIVAIMPVCVFSGPGVVSNNLIAPGSSGSPLLNSDSEVIGVVYASGTDIPSGWTFSVPHRYLKEIYDKL